MAKLLNGKELSLFIQEQQAKEVRSLKQSKNIKPTLAIIRTNPNPVTDTYVNLKAKYGEGIGVDVKIYDCDEQEIKNVISECNSNNEIQGIIVQLPLKNSENTDEIVDLIDIKKDVDGLNQNTTYDPATPTAINWLLAGYNIELLGKNIVINGGGRLVGAPLAKMWQSSGYNVTLITSKTDNKEDILRNADVIISAVGKPEIITSEMIKEGAVVVDAGTSTDSNGIVGDVENEARNREDIKITPVKGGVGPLTVCALFHNVLLASRIYAK